jgi:hypothetical protein
VDKLGLKKCPLHQERPNVLGCRCCRQLKRKIIGDISPEMGDAPMVVGHQNTIKIKQLKDPERFFHSNGFSLKM